VELQSGQRNGWPIGGRSGPLDFMLGVPFLIIFFP
jgi:hypothetical protein